MLAKLSESSEKSLLQIWRIRTLCLSAKKKFGLVQITANLFARFCTKPNVFFLWFVAPSPQFGFLAVACGCRAPLVVALRNRRYSRNGCHHIIAHVPPVSTLLKASHKMQPNCVQRKQEQQIFSYRFADHKGKTAFMEREENYQEWFAVMISHSCSMQMVIQSVPLFHQYVTTTNWQQKPG